MKFEVKASRSPGTPAREFRKWVIIGAVIGAVLAGLGAMLAIGIVMIAGAVVGAAIGAVYGFFKAILAVFKRD